MIERRWRTASTMLPVPASPLERIIAAPSEMRRSASPRFVAPHTNGTSKANLSMWWASSAGVRTSLSSTKSTPSACRIWASTKCPMRALAITGIDTAASMPSIISGSLIRATPPSRRMSAGTRSSAITAQAPASSAIAACSGVTTSMMTPPLSISASPRLTGNVPVARVVDVMITHANERPRAAGSRCCGAPGGRQNDAVVAFGVGSSTQVRPGRQLDRRPVDVEQRERSRGGRRATRSRSDHVAAGEHVGCRRRRSAASGLPEIAGLRRYIVQDDDVVRGDLLARGGVGVRRAVHLPAVHAGRGIPRPSGRGSASSWTSTPAAGMPSGSSPSLTVGELLAAARPWSGSASCPERRRSRRRGCAGSAGRAGGTCRGRPG